MKTWYKAVCDEHKEMINFFTNNIQTSYHYFYGPNGEAKGSEELINSWFQTHYGCKLRMIHLDTDLDECYNNGYKDIKHPEHEKYIYDKNICGECGRGLLNNCLKCNK